MLPLAVNRTTPSRAEAAASSSRWELASGARGVAATATCRRCGRVVHIRADGALKEPRVAR
jgi:hypothetical protein